MTKKIKVLFREDFKGIETKNQDIKTGQTRNIDAIWKTRIVQDKRGKVLEELDE